MKIIEESSAQGVSERSFELEVAAERVPGVLWAPAGAKTARPLVLLGHGGGQNKRSLAPFAQRLARQDGYAVAAIDAPGHGDRVTPAETARIVERMRKEGASAVIEQQQKQWSGRERAVAEWKATLDALQPIDCVGSAQPVGYWGLSMGSIFGLPLLASEPRITCAVLGLLGARVGAEDLCATAARIAVPLLFMFQLHDDFVKLELGVALFEAFGSQIKSMHLNPGPHVGVPMFEREYYETFLVRYLGKVG
jgi:dienelactone hydrolase